MKRQSLKKKDIVKILSDRNRDFSKEDIEEIVDLIFNAMTEALKQERRIEIRGFGNFSVRIQKKREFINPKTGKLTTCDQSRRVVFRAGKNLIQIQE